MLSGAVESLVVGSQFLVSLMLSTRNESATMTSTRTMLISNEFEPSFMSSFNGSLNASQPTIMDAYPSPFNKDLAFPEDIYSLVLWAFAWALLHAVTARFVLAPLSFVMVPSPKSGTPEECKKADKDRVKFQTASWRAFLYSISAVLGVYICSQETSWVFDSKLYFEGYPHKTT
ncbi:hypothetical protein HDU98_004695 [Podochytrium sp. JEL0797]|nr:hypothetical protein HDU98_004695 [Podochytrium sp. JEL0797]